MKRGAATVRHRKVAKGALFREVQRFRHWFFWVPMIVATGVIWWQFGQQMVLGHPQGTEPIPDWLAWVLTIVFGIGIPAFASSCAWSPRCAPVSCG